jgi:hypothetical protein
MAVLLSTDPICFARDENNDRIVPGRIVGGLDAILILVRTAWQLWRDEWFLNRSIGVPWIATRDGLVTRADAILGQPYDAAKLARALRGEALAINGVRDVIEFKSAFDSGIRNVTASCVIRSSFGDAPLSVALAV